MQAAARRATHSCAVCRSGTVSCKRLPAHRHGAVAASAGSQAFGGGSGFGGMFGKKEEDPASQDPGGFTPETMRSLENSSQALRRWGWVSFWIQLALTLTSSGILLFSIAFTATVCAAALQGPRVSLYMVIVGIIASIFSTFWAFGYTRLARKVRRYARSSGTAEAERPGIKIQKKDVKRTLRNGITINVIGMGAALLSLQAMVGMLVAKTLSSASVNPFYGGAGQSNLNPVVALDVFLVQAATNTLLSHFTSLVLCFLLLRAVDT